jgi:hypothetical protein
MASNKAGLNVPWVWTRRVIARNWRCKPWEVDFAPADEVQLEIRLHNLESEYVRRPGG